MLPPSWQLKTPLDAIIFDCDGTLSAIEGIDELAEIKGKGATVRAMTAEAMGKTGLNPSLYHDRLQLVLPTKNDVLALGQSYIDHITKDTASVIQLFQRLRKEIYIISAGLYPAVAFFGESLGIPAKNIFAVGIQFDSQGRFVDFEQNSLLTHNDGKRNIVSHLTTKHPQIGYVGDGLNDLSVYDLVTRFVGYGGTYYRENIAARCQYYIDTKSMTPLLPLTLTHDEYIQLNKEERELYQQGLPDAIRVCS